VLPAIRRAPQAAGVSDDSDHKKGTTNGLRIPPEKKKNAGKAAQHQRPKNPKPPNRASTRQSCTWLGRQPMAAGDICANRARPRKLFRGNLCLQILSGQRLSTCNQLHLEKRGRRSSYVVRRFVHCAPPLAEKDGTLLTVLPRTAHNQTKNKTNLNERAGGATLTIKPHFKVRYIPSLKRRGRAEFPKNREKDGGKSGASIARSRS